MADGPANDAPYRLLADVAFGEGVVVAAFTNLYGCRIGDGTRIGPFVEIQRGAAIGARCKIQSHTFVCDGVEIGDEVFVGHGVVFVNDKFPRATTEEGELQTAGDWELLLTVVERRASVGSGAIVLGGVRIGEGAIVGAGAVVTRDIAPGDVVAGVPARVRALS
jgi:UDP-2-acetamido-3-amino-2,3-dideoxy-glucuronate N-acetyltransferase